MKIGIVSDSHGQAALLAEVMDIFASKDVQALVHCGDIDDESCLNVLSDCPFEVYLTAGNMDRYFRSLDQLCSQNNINFGRHSVELQLPDGSYISALHGHNEQLFSELVASGCFKYIFYGHTHIKDDRRIGSTRIINPGALVRSEVLTVAVLDTDTDELEYIELS